MTGSPRGMHVKWEKKIFKVTFTERSQVESFCFCFIAGSSVENPDLVDPSCRFACSS